MAVTRTALLFLLVVAAVAGPRRSAAGRALRQDRGYIDARVVNKPLKGSPTSQTAAIPSDSSFPAAESSASSSHLGVHRTVNTTRRTYAVAKVEVGYEYDNKTWRSPQPSSVQPRTRSAQDLPRGGPNRSNGAPNMPALVLGRVVHAQTYTGATATAATDALALNRGGRSATSANMVTSRQPPLRRTGPNAAWAVTSQPAGSAALEGKSDGLIALAQADSAIALAQVEKPGSNKTNKSHPNKWSPPGWEHGSRRLRGMHTTGLTIGRIGRST